MSIYATWLSIDDYEHEPGCAVYRLLGEYPISEAFPGGALYVGAGPDLERVYARVPGAACTCGHQPPLIYQGPNVCPSAGGPRGGSVSFCAVPDFLHPDATEEMRDRDEGILVDFARLWVTEAGGEDPGEGYGPVSAVVVLDRSQVGKLRDTLTQWLEAEERA